MLEETKRKLSEALKIKYGIDPTYRARVSQKTREAMQKILSDPEKRADYLEKQREAHTVEVCGRQAETLRQTLSSPEKKEELTNVHKRLFTNPIYRENYLKGRKKMRQNTRWREHLSQSHGGQVPWNKGRRGLQTSWTKGLTKETDERMARYSERMKRNNPTKLEEVREKMRRKRLEQIIPCKDTGIEKKMQEMLKGKGLKFQTHYPILGQPDIAIENKKIAIFCDGCYWHGCPTHHPEIGRREKDEEITNFLKSKGWIVLRFWEHELNEGLEKCVAHVIEAIR